MLETSEPLPFLTSPELRTGGRIKAEPEDFQVEEIPAYEPCGEGEHLYLWIEKRDISANYLTRHLARCLNIQQKVIGVAGLKDRRAITRQWVSVPWKSRENLEAVNTDDIRVLKQSRHTNKLKTGHLRGNRFTIRVRDCVDGFTSAVEPLLNEIRQRGVPNYYGDQRFGHDRETLILGRELLLGEKTAKDIPADKRRFLTRLSISAVQSELFNRVLATRIQSDRLHRVLAGDALQVCASGGIFISEESAVDQARLDAREIVPTGPLFGPKMKVPAGAAGELESSILSESGLTMEHFASQKRFAPGARRALFQWIDEIEAELGDDGFTMQMTLPSGTYATIVLREFMKPDDAT